MKKYRFLKGLALILVAVMLFSCLPLTATASTMDNSTETETEQSQSQNNYNDMIEVPLEESTEDIYILAEDTSKRGEFEKHYLCSDGRFVAVTYPEAVHYQDESGEWSDIDNSLSLNSAKGVYEAENGDFKISFHAPVQSSDTSVASTTGAETTAISGGTVTIEPVQTQPESLITLTKGEQTLSWTLTAIKSPSASGSMTAGMMNTEQSASTLSVDSAMTVNVMGEIKSNTQTETEFIKKNVKDPDAFALPKISNQVQYDSLFGADEGISVRYTTYRNKIKEDIIISKETDIESFSMLVNCSGLTPVLNTDGSVDLLDGDGEMVYHVGAPYMYDAAYSICDVEVTLVTKGDICIITYTPDSEWMSSPYREYPIVLDPSVSTSEYTTNVYDTYVGPNVNTSQKDAAYLYYHGGQAALIGFRNLPVIHESMPIYRAQLRVNLMYAQLTETVLYLRTFYLSSGQQNIQNMMYDDYTDITKHSVGTSFALVANSTVTFDITQKINQIYSNDDYANFAISTDEDYMAFCYPIVSADNGSGEGPRLIVYYGYELPCGLYKEDVVQLKNVHMTNYSMSLLENSTSNGNHVVLKNDQLSVYNQFVLRKNTATGGYYFNTLAVTNAERCLTVYDDNTVRVCDDYIPETQEWVLVGAGDSSFNIVSRTNMNKCLSYMVQTIDNKAQLCVCLSNTATDEQETDMQMQRWQIYRNGELYSQESCVYVEFSFDQAFIKLYQGDTETTAEVKARLSDIILNEVFPIVSSVYGELCEITMVNSQTSVNDYVSNADACPNKGADGHCACITDAECTLTYSDSPFTNNSYDGFEQMSHCDSAIRIRNNLIIDIPDNTIRITYTGNELCFTDDHDYPAVAGLSDYEHPIIVINESLNNDEGNIDISNFTLVTVHEIAHLYGITSHHNADINADSCVIVAGRTFYSYIQMNVYSDFLCTSCVNTIKSNKTKWFEWRESQ